MALHKILKIVVALIGVVGLILAGMIWAENDAIKVGESQGLVDAMMTITWIVVIIAIVLVVIFVLKGLFSGNAKNTLIGIGAFVFVLAISYITASGEETVLKDGDILSETGAKMVSAGITAFFILAAVAIILMVGSGAKKILTK